MNLLAISAGGMRSALAKHERASDKLVRSFAGESDAAPEQAIVEQVEADAEFRANAAAVRIAADMMAELLEIQRDG